MPSSATAAAPLPTAAEPDPKAAAGARAPTLSLAAWRQFMAVAKPYWLGDRKVAAWSLLGLLILLMLLETHLAVRLIDRTGEMTSALAAQDRGRFWDAVRTCLIVLAFAVPVYAFYYYMRDAFANHWRRWLTHRFLDGYLGRRRYYELNAEGTVDNPDQRISEDINSFTGRSTHFLLIFIGAMMQLVAFSAVLWSISQALVAFLAVYALVGTVMALYVFGAPLIRLNFWQLRREADFRFGLMRLRENAESIAFYRGEAQERAQLDHSFQAVFNNYARLIKRQRSLNLFQRAFSQLTLVIPSIILADAVLSGDMEVGRAIQAGGAFAAVLASVSLIVDNFENLSRFVAGIGRLDTLRQALEAPADRRTPEPMEPEAAAAARRQLREQRREQRRARRRGGVPSATAAAPVAALSPQACGEIEAREGERFAVEGLDLYTPRFARLLVRDLSLDLQPGDALLITGASGCGKSSLLRALAGLWRDGRGVVHHPPMDSVFFLPQRPYMQPGTLRSQMIYPARDTDLADEQLLEVLNAVQLPDLAGRVGGLDAVRDWEKELSIGEQQRLAFARVLVRQPRTVILDEATSALDSANEAALYERVRASGASVISIAHRPAVLAHHTHVLVLTGDGGWSLHPAEGFQFDEG
ncbi:ABC transporter ATP-binding protein/permease [Paracidovorax citrulli]|uniref:ABC transporter domain protein n=3 Tax=Paracidovorax citrulli TaxID=80869 RepID=A1TJ93_PARC0|nr:ABC transporter ATP-binding protein/permease [Paracidovorax citrulli]ABM31031.1 ABC transporter domain protein [Paracidovorax citrulli AAC00-1]PVY65212.1 putative ATP-binding cassette transporter [Paracidovorax citrulli]REG70598.1 putative ATP-binding cassette transporter [Paracidovorax citrulli]RLJ95150.1 putative ATP-binding cassette transporter [Paracidovorax citrulli]WIY29059.1 ABC transporter ATP-binding protein/permease [Paracidovorax citrulli]